MICTDYTPESVFLIFSMCTISFMSISFYASMTRFDITIAYSVSIGTSACMITLSLFMIFTNAPIVWLIYSSLGIILSVIFVVIDT
jgi:FtsH-binding integral membrane protein